MSNLTATRVKSANGHDRLHIMAENMPVIVADRETGKLTGDEYDGKNWY